MITQQKLKELFDYVDGKLISKTKSKRRSIGSILGDKRDTGYLTASVLGKCYRVHRLIFLYHHGFLPQQVDHINGVRDDNRIENLRQATAQQNNQNRKPTGKSKIKGVVWHKQSKKWVASICINRKSIHLGSFENIEDAKIVADKARLQLHGEYAHEHATKSIMVGRRT